MFLIQSLSDNLLENLDEGKLRTILEAMLPKVLAFFWSAALALVLYFVGMKVIGFIRKVFKKGLERHGAEIGVQQFLDAVIKIVCYIVLALMILHLFGVETTSFAAAVASLGVTVGLAMQGSLSNFAGGVLILVLKPFVVGDYIVEDTHKNEGTVAEISIFYTKLLTIDNKTIVIPNGTLANASLTNITNEEKRMVDLVFSISYDDDIRTAKEVIHKTVAKIDGRYSDDIQVFVKELASSSVDIGVRFWAPMDEYWNIRWQTLEEGKYALEEAGMTIPFQQIDIHTN
ncbi:MAG: mechanosensitive ion channel family protein [Lachnospiraceae bacterium]|nr:mechanosensitive ion channel family protein [Lachnospiraceae bacterium]